MTRAWIAALLGWAAVASDGVAAVAEGFEDNAEIVPGGGAAGVEIEGAAEGADGVFDVAGGEEFERGEVELFSGDGSGTGCGRHRGIL